MLSPYLGPLLGKPNPWRYTDRRQPVQLSATQWKKGKMRMQHTLKKLGRCTTFLFTHGTHGANAVSRRQEAPKMVKVSHVTRRP
jgi:hypothetical protein